MRAPIPAGWSVIVGKKRALHNFADYLLSDTGPSDFRLKSEFVYKTVALGLASPVGACVTSAHLLNPLRLITARTPVGESFAASTQTYLETLDCGHQVYKYSDWYWDEGGHLIDEPPKAKRRRCADCAEVQLTPKFKPQPVPYPKKKRIA